MNIFWNAQPFLSKPTIRKALPGPEWYAKKLSWFVQGQSYSEDLYIKRHNFLYCLLDCWFDAYYHNLEGLFKIRINWIFVFKVHKFIECLSGCFGIKIKVTGLIPKYDCFHNISWIADPAVGYCGCRNSGKECLWNINRYKNMWYCTSIDRWLVSKIVTVN